MWWLDWRGPPPHPTPPPHRLFFSSSHLYLPSFTPFRVFIFQTPFSLRVFLLSLWFIPLFYRAVSLFGQTIITPVLFCQFITSLSSISTLYFYVFISASLPSLPPHRYAIFCCAWRIHLACGRSGSDGYISGGVWWIATFSQPQWALFGLMQTFHWGELVDLGCLPGCSAAMPTPPGHSPGWQAPTQARGVSLPSGCPCLCLSCVVASFSHCAVVTIAPPSPAHHPFSLCLSKKKQCPLRPWPNPGQSRVAFGICRWDWTGQRAAVAASTETVKSWWFCMFELMKYKLCIL